MNFTVINLINSPEVQDNNMGLQIFHNKLTNVKENMFTYVR